MKNPVYEIAFAGRKLTVDKENFRKFLVTGFLEGTIITFKPDGKSHIKIHINKDKPANIFDVAGGFIGSDTKRILKEVFYVGRESDFT